MPRPRVLDPTIVAQVDEFGYLTASPVDGKLAYTYSRNDRFFLGIVGTKGQKARVLRRSDQRMSFPAFSPDGRGLAFAQDFDGDENHDIFTVSSRGDKEERLTGHPADDFSPEFSPDGKSLAFISNRKDDIENLYLMDLRRKATRQLTDQEHHIWRIAWRPSGDKIAVKAGEVESWIGLVDVAKGGVKKLLEASDPELAIGSDPWSPDGLTVAYTWAEEDHIDIGLLDVVSGRTRWVVRDDREKEEPSFSPDGRRIAFTALKDGDQVVVVKDLKSGKETTISPKRGHARDPVWLSDGRLALLHSSATTPESIFISGRGSKVLVRNSVERIPGAVEVKHVRYPSFDGRRIPALIFIPKKRNGAAIVHPHGGPESARTNYWGAADQLFATRGYVVIAPNYRGSTGYGKRFRKLSDRDLGGGDMRDVNEAARFLVSEGLVEGGRVGIWGISYGGYLSLHCPTQEPDLWAVAVPVVGFFDWATCYDGVRNFLRSYDIQKVGDVRKNPEFFAPRSPANFLHRLAAPVLLFAGANDPRCPAHESRRVAEKIRALGIACEYVEYPDEGHYPRRATNEVDLLKRTLDFLDRHLGLSEERGIAAPKALAPPKMRSRRRRRAT